MASLTCLTASQLISALAPNFAVLAAGRVLCAITHGLLWSVIAHSTRPAASTAKLGASAEIS
ncbi:hypothetical protein MAHJHV55_51920 [Mycobacterium avium subsp. hominissuis]